MGQTLWTLMVIGGFLLMINLIECRTFVKRQAIQNVIDPILLEEVPDEQDRDKRSQNHYNDPKWGVKSAVLGFVFNKINSFIDQKTQWVSQIDKTNIAKNKAYGIYPPVDPVVSISGIISGKINQALQASAPLITVVTNKLSGGSNPSGDHSGFNIGQLLGSFSGGSGAGATAPAAHVGATAYAAY